MCLSPLFLPFHSIVIECCTSIPDSIQTSSSFSLSLVLVYYFFFKSKMPIPAFPIRPMCICEFVCVRCYEHHHHFPKQIDNVMNNLHEKRTRLVIVIFCYLYMLGVKGERDRVKWWNWFIFILCEFTLITGHSGQSAQHSTHTYTSPIVHNVY